MFKPSSDFLLTIPKWCIFCGSFLLVMFHDCLCYDVCVFSLVVTCWERADLLALFCVVFFLCFVTFPYVSWSTSELRVRFVPLNMLKPTSNFLLTVPRWCFFCGSLLFVFHVCLYYAVFSVPCSLVITCWERADLLALLCVMFS